MAITKKFPLLLVLVALVAVAQADAFEIRGTVAEDNGARYWDGTTFDWLYYDLDNNVRSEFLNLTADISGRTIQARTLIYDTYKIKRTFKVIENGHGAELLRYFPDGKYYFLSWQGEPYIPVNYNGYTQSLSKLVIEQGNAISEKKSMVVGDTWDVGDGWILKAVEINAKSTPRTAVLSLSKNGIELYTARVNQGQTYIYSRPKVPLRTSKPPDLPFVLFFATFVDSIFAGATRDMVQLRYTWAISDSVVQISLGDKFGVMEVAAVNESNIQLYNYYNRHLSKGTTTDIMGPLSFKVADNDTLRYYPMARMFLSGGGGEPFR